MRHGRRGAINARGVHGRDGKDSPVAAQNGREAAAQAERSGKGRNRAGN